MGHRLRWQNPRSAAAIIACIATGAAGFVFGAVVGAAGFGVLSSAGRDSERVKAEKAVLELSMTEERLSKSTAEVIECFNVLRKIREKHPEVIEELRKDGISIPDF